MLPSHVDGQKESSPPTFSVGSNSSFSVMLPANVATGYAWRIVQKEGDNVVDSVGHTYRLNAVGFPLLGGAESFLFSAKGKGRSVITFHYARSWEKSAPAQVRRVIVDVE